MAHFQASRPDWLKLRRHIERRWPEVEGGNLDRFRGNLDGLVDEIHHRSGESRSLIWDFLEYDRSEAAPRAGRAGEAAKQYAFHAVATAAAAPKILANDARAAYETARDLARRRPLEIAAGCFVSGVVVGAFLCVLMRRR